MSSHRLSGLVSGLASTALAVLVLGVASGAVRAQSVGYSIEPGASYIYWDDDLGLSDRWLYGGGIAFELGERIRLTPFYMQGDGITANTDGLVDEDGSPLFPGIDEFGVDVRHYGVDMDIDLLKHSVTPFLRLGGGVLRLDPETGETLDRIALSYGGGLRFGIGRTSIRLSAEGNTFRLDPARLYDPAEASADEGELTNWIANARVSIPISRQRDSRAIGLVTSSAPLGVFAGQLNFADELGLGDQRLVGARAGIAFNPLVSLTGFYWQGVNDDVNEFQDVRGYGAEAQFQLGTGTGISPFLIAGGGRIDFDEDSENAELAGQSDKTALILGGGLTFSLTDRIDLQASVRDYLIDTTQELEEVSDPGELVNNWLYSVGVTFRIGGTTAATRSRREADAVAEEMARLQEQIRRLEEGETPMPVDSLVVPRTQADSAVMQQTMVGPEGRVITLPVLEEGAIYIRFGPEGWDTQGAGAARGMMMERGDLRSIIQEELRSAAGDPDEELSVAEIEERLLNRLEQRGVVGRTGVAPGDAAISPYLMERLDAIERRLMDRLERIEDEERDADRGGRVEAVEPSIMESGAFGRARRFNPLAVQPYGGLSVGDDATQGVVGARFDFGRVSEGGRIRFVPELAVGFGEGDTSVSAMANFAFPLTSNDTRGVAPYIVGGAGIFTPTLLGITTGVGTGFNLGDFDAFAEVQGINLFSRTRFLFGLRLPL